jgi:outer membrane lipoprotein-sorting protein
MTSKLLSAVLFVFFLGVGTVSVGAETRPSVSDFLGQVQATYDKVQSYSSVGDITSDFSRPGTGHKESPFNYSFSIKLARPNLYRIEWEMHSPNMTMKGAAWSAGDGNFVSLPGQTNPFHPKDLTTALAMATGVSGGAAATIPGVFFSMGNDDLKRLKDAAFGPDAAIEGDPCYVITGNAAPIKATLWISRKSKLIRQMRTDLSGPMKMPEITDQEASRVVELMGQKPTAEAIQRMKAQMASARTMMGSGITGFSIQVHRKIVVNPALRKADFTPPSTASK